MNWVRTLRFKDMDSDSVAEHAQPMWTSLSADDVDQFIAILRSYALHDHEIDILVDRFVSNKTFADIKDTHGFVDIPDVYQIYKNALKKIEKAIAYLELNS